MIFGPRLEGYISSGTEGEAMNFREHRWQGSDVLGMYSEAQATWHCQSFGCFIGKGRRSGQNVDWGHIVQELDCTKRRH